jgi:urea carboxylase system permease
MSTTVPGPSHAADLDDLATYGYKQKLSRSLGSFSSFAAGFSYISILTGMFQLFGFGYGFGGPLLFWTWLVVLVGQFCVALVFAELSARYPIAGSVYQWAKKASSRPGAWMAGWMMLIGSLVTIAAVAIAFQVVLPSIWSGFQVFGDDAQNAVFLGSCAVVLTTIISLLGVKFMAVVNNIGVAAELIGVGLIILLLLFHIQRGPGVIFDSQGIGGPGTYGWESLGYLGPLLMAAIMPAYVMYGFDTAGSLAEETLDPRRTTPKALLRALAAAGLAGAALLLLALMTADSLDPSVLGVGGLPSVLESALGSTVGKLLLIDVAFAIFICTLAIQTASIRLAFSMARDHALPFGRQLAHVTEKRHSPVVPAIVSGLIAIGLLVLNVGNAKIFLLITSVAIAIVYIAYLLVTVPVMRQRLRGWPQDAGKSGWFYLGRTGGLVVNAAAIVYGAAMLINLLWPRNAIYGDGIYAWGGMIFIAGIIVVGAIYYGARQHGRDERIADEHRHVPLTEPGLTPDTV